MGIAGRVSASPGAAASPVSSPHFQWRLEPGARRVRFLGWSQPDGSPGDGGAPNSLRTANSVLVNQFELRPGRGASHATDDPTIEDPSTPVPAPPEPCLGPSADPGGRRRGGYRGGRSGARAGLGSSRRLGNRVSPGDVRRPRERPGRQTHHRAGDQRRPAGGVGSDSGRSGAQPRPGSRPGGRGHRHRYAAVVAALAGRWPGDRDQDPEDSRGDDDGIGGSGVAPRRGTGALRPPGERRRLPGRGRSPAGPASRPAGDHCRAGRAIRGRGRLPAGRRRPLALGDGCFSHQRPDLVRRPSGGRTGRPG